MRNLKCSFFFGQIFSYFLNFRFVQMQMQHNYDNLMRCNENVCFGSCEFEFIVFRHLSVGESPNRFYARGSPFMYVSIET